MKQYLDDARALLGKRRAVVFLVVLVLVGYGFWITNGTVSIDGLESTRYTGSGNAMLKAGRFGFVMSKYLRGGSWGTNFSSELLGVCALLMAGVNYAIALRRASRDRLTVFPCLIFCGVFVTYPLINEIWVYAGAGFNISFGYLLVSGALLLVQAWLHGRGRHWLMAAATFAMMWAAAGYESLLCVYIFLVFAVLAVQVIYGPAEEKKFREVIRQGLIYAVILAAGLVLRVVVHKAILLLMELDYSPNGETILAWSYWTPDMVLRNLLQDGIQVYLLKALVYFPLTELLWAAVVLLPLGLGAGRKHGWVLVLLGAGMYLSLVLLFIIQGTPSPYRTCQVFGVFVAFTAMMLLTWLEGIPWGRLRWMHRAVCAAACWLCLFQAVYLGNLLHTNHRRYQEELTVAHSVGAALESREDPEKPVIFVGRYEISQRVLEEASIPADSAAWQRYQEAMARYCEYYGRDYDRLVSRKLPQSNVNSYLAWAVDAFGGQESLYSFFEYHGHSYVPADFDAVYAEAVEYARETDMSVYPNKGYLVELEDYVIVRLGEELDAQ